jgi:hypothetical protein
VDTDVITSNTNYKMHTTKNARVPESPGIAHILWLAAQLECLKALSAWRELTGQRRRAAFLAYQAALDREEAAARRLEATLMEARRSARVVAT